ncbi:hypothetical protein [Ochrobactrum sp. 3-3]|uniref:hypothetical protein n=1 Tax=Ochrobactrum sp. 3-3 TaxID=1830124 RepID=UPI000DF00DFE|nr:hypothetical protein [Ochrobactrum sp. 3-3]
MPLNTNAEGLASFQDGQRELEISTEKLVSISSKSIGSFHTGRQRRALFLLSKLIMHNASIISISDKFFEDPQTMLIDHFSMAVLGRASIDAALMIMYISEPKLDRNRWDFRRQLLFLHDINNRNRFLKPLRKNGVELGFYENYEEVRKGIQEKIEKLGASMLFSSEKITEYKNGHHLFVSGIRGAVREAGWNVDEFDLHQSYFSAYVHSHPVSFMRADEHDIQFGGASSFQIDFCHFITSTIATYTESVAGRMTAFSDPELGDPIGHVE